MNKEITQVATAFQNTDLIKRLKIGKVSKGEYLDLLYSFYAIFQSIEHYAGATLPYVGMARLYAVKDDIRTLQGNDYVVDDKVPAPALAYADFVLGTYEADIEGMNAHIYATYIQTILIGHSFKETMKFPKKTFNLGIVSAMTLDRLKVDDDTLLTAYKYLTEIAIYIGERERECV